MIFRESGYGSKVVKRDTVARGLIQIYIEQRNGNILRGFPDPGVGPTRAVKMMLVTFSGGVATAVSISSLSSIITIIIHNLEVISISNWIGFGDESTPS